MPKLNDLHAADDPLQILLGTQERLPREAGGIHSFKELLERRATCSAGTLVAVGLGLVVMLLSGS